MSTIQSSLFAAAIAVCVLCAFLANSDSSKPRKRSRYLVAYLALEVLKSLPQASSESRGSTCLSIAGKCSTVTRCWLNCKAG
jgi:hypothetical protein